MSTRGDMEWVAAKLGNIERELKDRNDARLDAFTNLLSSLESSLAELIENFERGGGAAAIEAMAKAIGSIKMPEVTVNVSPTPIKMPEVTVNVSPTPITVEAVMPAMPPMPPAQIHVMPAQQKGATWEIRMPGAGYNGADRVIKITRTN